MRILIIILLVLIILFLFEKAVCFLYSYTKSIRVEKASLDVNNNSHSDEYQKDNTCRLIKMVKQLLYGYIMYSLERLGKVPSQKYRLFMLRHVYCMKIAKKVIIYHGFHIRAPWNITIGKGSIVGDGVTLDGRNGLIIGENVNISTEVYIYTEQHDVNDPFFESNDSGGRVVIGNRAWLSSRTTILPNISIGEGSVLASGAVATKDTDDYCIYGGVPANKIGSRNKDLKYQFNGEYIPFY